jgi:hypothetical protein
MKTGRLTIVFWATLAIAVSTSTFADGVYKWTDEDGNVHFGDRPTGEPSEERLKVSYNRTDAEALDLRVQSEREVADSLQESRAAAIEEKRVAEEERLAAEENQARCESSRAKLNAKRTAQRLYRTDEAGERVFLDDAQRAESIAKSESAITENCGG